MKSLPRTIAGAMAVIALLALNLAVARSVFRVNEEIVIGAAVACVLLQIAVFLALRSRGRARAFWLGFLLLDTTCTASFVWAMLFPEVLGLTSPGAVHRQPGSPLYVAWMGYMQRASEPLVPFFFDLAHDHEPELVKAAVFRGVLWAAPQVAGAFLGGLAAWALHALMSRRRSTAVATTSVVSD